MPRQLGIPDALKRFGVKTETVPGWQTRGSSAFTPRGVVCHWTAGPRGTKGRPSLNVVTYGRPGLPGPLCQVYLDRNGIAVVVAAGRSNHAGAGGWKGLSGNSMVFGIEAESAGNDDWTAAQRREYPKVAAALAWLAGRSEAYVCGHNEWAPRRKIDIRDWDMSRMRREVRQVLAGGIPAPTPTPEKEWWHGMKQVREFYGTEQSIPARTSDNILRARDGGAQMALVGPAEYAYITATIKAGQVAKGSVDLSIAEIVDGRITRKLATTQTQGGRASVGAAWSLADSKGSLAVVADIYSDERFSIDWVEISGVRAD